MDRPIRLSAALAALAAAATLAAAPRDAAYERNWPSWRGPLGSGVAPHADPPTRWSETENVRWKAAIPGSGHSSPIVWEDRVYLLTAVGAAGGDEAEGGEAPPPRGRGVEPRGPVAFRVLALDRASGETVWERTATTARPHEGTHSTATWASASAVTDGEVLVASFGSNGLYVYDLEGELLWQRDLGDQRTRNAFGEGSSPALYGKVVVVNWDHEGDSFIVALDRDSGRELWRTARDEPTSWSTPVVVEVEGRPQVVVSATNRVRGYDLATGEPLWSAGGMTVNTIPTPIYAGGVVYAMGGFRGSALAALHLAGARGDLDGSDAAVWSYGRDTSYVPSALLDGGRLYFLKVNTGILTVLDAASGAKLYGPERLPGIEGVYASPVAAAGRVYVAGQNGTTVVLTAGDRLEVLARNPLDDGFDASPALAGRQLFLRGRAHLYCLEERGEGGGESAPAGAS